MTSTAPTLKTNFNPSLHNGKINVRNNRYISIIILIMHLLAGPCLARSAMFNISSGIDKNFDDAFVLIALFTTGIAGVAGIFIAFSNFKYMYNKSYVDMNLSNPMTKKQKFLSDYISGLVSYAGPFLISNVITWTLILIGHLTFDGNTYMIGADPINAYEYYCTFFSEFAEFCATANIAGLLTMIMLYTVTVLTISCCGSLFETVLYTIIVNAAIPLVVLLIYVNIFSSETIYGTNYDHILLFIETLIAPLGGIIFLVYHTEAIGNNSNDLFNLCPDTLPWAIGYIIFTAIYFVIAYQLYKRRKAEQVSKPFIYRGMFHFCMICTALCLMILVKEIVGSGNLSTVIIPFVAYFVLYVISNRGFKKIWKCIVQYIAVVAIFIGFMFVSDSTGFFGVAKKVPDANNVERIYLGYSGLQGIYTTNNFSGTLNSPNKENTSENFIYEITSPENIERIVNIHQAIVNDKSKDSAYDSTYISPYNLYEDYYITSSFSIYYEMKNGTTMTRTYYGLPVECLDELMALDVSEEYKAQAADFSKNLILEWSDETHIEVILSSKSNLITDIKPEFHEKLAAAYSNDIRNLTAEQYFRSTAKSRYMLTVGTGYLLRVNENFPETMKLLSENGYLFSEAEINTLKTDEAVRLIDHEGYVIFSLEDYKALTGLELSYYGIGHSMYWNSHKIAANEAKENGMTDEETGYDTMLKYGKYITKMSEEALELYSVCYSRYIAEEPCYTIYADGELYTVPYEYSELAEKVYLSGTSTKPEYEYYD